MGKTIPCALSCSGKTRKQCVYRPPAHEHVHAWAGGSGTGPETLDHNRYLLNAPEPAILDAGAVDLAADYLMAGHSLGEHKILTPHAGELERFLRRIHEHSPQRWEEMLDGALVPSREDINAEPFRWVRAACELSGATVMLKGSTTLIAAPVGATYQRARGYRVACYRRKRRHPHRYSGCSLGTIYGGCTGTS